MKKENKPAEYMPLNGRFRKVIEYINPIIGDERGLYKNVQKRHYSNDYSSKAAGGGIGLRHNSEHILSSY